MSAPVISIRCAYLSSRITRTHWTLFGSYLEQLGHIVLSASSKAEALKQIPMADCHVLISDIGLPDGNGWELMQELENLSPRYAGAISGYGMKADREMSAGAGFATIS